MKSSAQLGLVFGLSLMAGLGHWYVEARASGEDVEQGRSDPFAEAPLKENEVRLSQVWNQVGLVWIDARTRDSWKEDGLFGSINMSRLLEPSLEAQVEKHFATLEPAYQIVIYCDGPDCSLSHELEEYLVGLELFEGRISVLKGGHDALRAAGLVRDPSPAR